jgi:uncharacterized protein (DUF2336 family)
MIRQTLRRVFGRYGRGVSRHDLEQLKLLARSRDPDDRVKAASDPGITPEILHYLARDSSAKVRLAVAANELTPRQADLLLALDDSLEVRRRIALKISQNLQDASKETSKVWNLTIKVLEALAHDNLAEVRRLIAQSARSIEKVPASLMTGLGGDRESDVAVPALGYVGRIEDNDLVRIVEEAPSQSVVGAVAARPAIGPSVSKAVVDHGDTPSIAILLRNHSAAIPPDTLDRVVDRAQPIEPWHQPLVERPQLTDSAAIRLASFVADKLLQVLKSRPDINPETNAAISIVIEKRGHGVEQVVPEVVDTEGPLNRARRLNAQGLLNEDAVLEQVGGDTQFVIAALSLRARIPPAVVQKILSSHSAKALIALAWKSGFSMRLGTQLQLRFARLPPKARISAAPGGNFPLGEAEMRWQIEFFATLVTGDR